MVDRFTCHTAKLLPTWPQVGARFVQAGAKLQPKCCNLLSGNSGNSGNHGLSQMFGKNVKFGLFRKLQILLPGPFGPHVRTCGHMSGRMATRQDSWPHVRTCGLMSKSRQHVRTWGTQGPFTGFSEIHKTTSKYRISVQRM